MKTYRDFDNDPIRFGYEEGAKFLQKLQDGGRHYIPIVDYSVLFYCIIRLPSPLLFSIKKTCRTSYADTHKSPQQLLS